MYKASLPEPQAWVRYFRCVSGSRRFAAPEAPWEAARRAPPVRQHEELPAGVEVRDLRLHPDHRGSFMEAFRREWAIGVDPVQWNIVNGEPGAMRGVHVHPRHTDFIVPLAGTSTVGVADIRPDSPTRGLAATIALDAEAPAAVTIPNGVAHGLLTHERSIHVYAVSHPWDPADEIPCRWDDPALGIDWPESARHLSEQDASAPPLSEVLEALGWGSLAPR
jgi:dTDP-4-dehydrorhamnose 3,5-epimerase